MPDKQSKAKPGIFVRMLQSSARLGLELLSYIPGPIGSASSLTLAGLAYKQGKRFEAGVDVLGAIPFGRMIGRLLGVGAVAAGGVLMALGDRTQANKALKAGASLATDSTKLRAIARALRQLGSAASYLAPMAGPLRGPITFLANEAAHSGLLALKFVKYVAISYASWVARAAAKAAQAATGKTTGGSNAAKEAARMAADAVEGSDAASPGVGGAAAGGTEAPAEQRQQRRQQARSGGPARG